MLIDPAIQENNLVILMKCSKIGINSNPLVSLLGIYPRKIIRCSDPDLCTDSFTQRENGSKEVLQEIMQETFPGQKVNSNGQMERKC